ncbi:hypothetical protein C8T65DRAFT_678075, partial [Cerioporus squamosus]
LLGAFLAWGLQAHVLHWFPQDRRLLKLLVWGTFIWEWVQIGLVTQSYFEIYVYDYGSIQSLTSYHNTWFSAPIMTAVVSFVVQCFFAWRIWMLSCSKLSFAQMALGIAGGVIVVVDALIAGSMAYLVSIEHRQAVASNAPLIYLLIWQLLSSKTGIKQSDAMIHKLVRLGVETGALTAAVALVYAIAFMTHTVTLVLPKLYSNTFLVSLNNRAFTSRPGVLTQSFTASGGSSTVPTSRLGNRALFGDAGRAGSHRGIRIDVSQETYPTRDTSKDVIDLVPMGREERSGSV